MDDQRLSAAALGAAADRRRGGRSFRASQAAVIGIAIFTVASIACALAADLTLLLAARALQGIGAAILLPNSLATLGHSFTGEARGKAIGTWAESAPSPARSARRSAAGWSMRSAGARSSMSTCRWRRPRS
jgi:MFS family permease